MYPLAAGETVCPECGRAYGSANAESFALKPGTILDGKYLVGEMLGQGGFGITYIGFDLLLEQKVAIKEYYPMSTGMVSRDGHSTVVWSSVMMGKTGTQKGFDSFLKEARKMAKLGGIPGVVGVKSVFIQNETAYIVMDFIEGETLLKKLQKNGPMDFDSCVRLMTPIIQALAEVHRHGIIHRDISPDNIMVRPDGKLILLDLGAAKDLDIQGNDGSVQSSQMVAKHGFSPIEQYSKSGNVGPWTDIYAMAATIYYCCTGILPPPATDRTIDDTLSCQPRLTQNQFDAISLCMSVLPKNRPQDMGAMLQVLAATGVPKTEPVEPPKKTEPVTPPKKEKPVAPRETEPVRQTPPPGTEPVKPKEKWQRRKGPASAIAAAIVALILAVGIGGRMVSKKAAPAEQPATKTAISKSTPQPTQTVPMETFVMAEPDSIYSYGLSDSSEYANTPFWGQEQYTRGEVKTVTFRSSLTGAPSGAWDVSDAGDRSILAWMDGGNLYVAANGRIAPNPYASRMFDYFVNVRKIDFGDCVDTSNVTKMNSMFGSCSSLVDLDLSRFDTSNVVNMGGMFEDCSSLTSLDVSSFDTSNVTDMSGMFSGCSSLTSLDVGGFDTSNVTDMSYMFNNCSGLTSLNLSGFDMSSVEYMDGMFSRCGNLTSLDLSSLDTSNVINMGWVFSDCSGLISLDLSGFDTSSVEYMGGMFSGCGNLTSLDLSSLDTSNVTDMSYMFINCSGLTSLNLSSFNTSNVENMRLMFYNCSSLTSLDISGFKASRGTETDGIFLGCNKLTDLQCSDSKILLEYKNR